MKSNKLKFTCSLIAITMFAICILRFPLNTADAIRSGMQLCVQTVIPSLFPFFILSGLIIDTGIAGCLGKLCKRLMRPLFKADGAGACPLILGLIGGYPIGAASAVSLYKNNTCSKAQTEHLLSFCSNSGPGFIIGAVGIGVFRSPKIGVILYTVHACTAILTGVITGAFRKLPPVENSTASCASLSLSQAFTSSVKAALQSTLNICSFVITFAFIIGFFNSFSVFQNISRLLSNFCSVPPDIITAFFHGLLEMTNGICSLPSCAGSLPLHITVCAVLLGWGGLSVHFQTLSVIGDSRLSAKPYFIGKLLHGALSGIAVTLLFKLHIFNIPTAAFALSHDATPLPTMAYSAVANAGIGAGLLLTIFFALIFLEISQNDWKNARK